MALIALFDTLFHGLKNRLITLDRRWNAYLVAVAPEQIQTRAIGLNRTDLVPRGREFPVAKAVLVDLYGAAALDDPADKREDINDKKCARKGKIADVLPNIKGNEHGEKEHKRHDRNDRRSLQKCRRRRMRTDQFAEVFLLGWQER